MQTWKLSIDGEFETDEEAIKDLSDKYMKCSKFDLPGTSVPELLTSTKNVYPDGSPAKRVYLFIEHEVFGIKQMVQKYILNIYPFKQDHFWDADHIRIPTKKFQYKIITDEKSINLTRL